MLRAGLLFALFAVAAVASGGAAQEKDIRDGRDHPLISRYTGAFIVGSSETAFDEFELPLGPAAAGGKLTKSERLRGKRTRILYVGPPQRSTLEVFTNYEQALGTAGFRVLFSCAAEACGPGSMSRAVYPIENRLTQSGRNSEMAYSIPREQRYLSATLARQGSNVHISLYIAREGNSGLERLYNRAVVLLDVVESVPMETGRVTVDAAVMAKELAASGHIALYEIYFDSGSATLTPQSDTTLREIAALLGKDARLQLFVVGHTDNVGSFQTNLDLSRRRATAVVRALSTAHGVEAGRLQPEGVGMLAPLASNDTDAGRARNRRVELVRR
jgi:OmpA-OmpF porin, OOP family